jgi:hypothetical protein
MRASNVFTATSRSRSETEMRAFLDKRLGELKTIGGTWRLVETKHFFCFSNIKTHVDKRQKFCGCFVSFNYV